MHVSMVQWYGAPSVTDVIFCMERILCHKRHKLMTEPCNTIMPFVHCPHIRIVSTKYWRKHIRRKQNGWFMSCTELAVVLFILWTKGWMHFSICGQNKSNFIDKSNYVHIIHILSQHLYFCDIEAYTSLSSLCLRAQNTLSNRVTYRMYQTKTKTLM